MNENPIKSLQELLKNYGNEHNSSSSATKKEVDTVAKCIAPLVMAVQDLNKRLAEVEAKIIIEKNKAAIDKQLIV